MLWTFDLPEIVYTAFIDQAWQNMLSSIVWPPAHDVLLLIRIQLMFMEEHEA